MVLGFFKEACIFFCWQLVMFTLNDMETRKSTEWRCDGFYGIEIFVLFCSIWDVCVVTGRRMTMWQGSYQMKCTRCKSCGTVVEG